MRANDTDIILTDKVCGKTLSKLNFQQIFSADKICHFLRAQTIQISLQIFSTNFSAEKSVWFASGLIEYEVFCQDREHALKF